MVYEIGLYPMKCPKSLYLVLLLRLTPGQRGSPGTISVKFYRKVRHGQGTKRCRNIAKISIAWVGCTSATNVTDRRQTDDRETDGRRYIANVNWLTVLYAVCVMGPTKYFRLRAPQSLNQALLACYWYVHMIFVHIVATFVLKFVVECFGTQSTDQTTSSSVWRTFILSTQHRPCGATLCVASIQALYLLQRQCLCIVRTTYRRSDISSFSFP